MSGFLDFGKSDDALGDNQSRNCLEVICKNERNRQASLQPPNPKATVLEPFLKAFCGFIFLNFIQALFRQPGDHRAGGPERDRVSEENDSHVEHEKSGLDRCPRKRQTCEAPNKKHHRHQLEGVPDDPQRGGAPEDLREHHEPPHAEHCEESE